MGPADGSAGAAGDALVETGEKARCPPCLRYRRVVPLA
jgi:hypothetical protein